MSRSWASALQPLGTSCDPTSQPSAPVATVCVSSKNYGPPPHPPVIEQLAFEVRDREILAILGPSGCGKTTLLRILAGLDTDYEGRVIVDDCPVRGPGRARGVVFQEARLLPWLTVASNVAFALPDGLHAPERRRRVTAALSLVGLTDHADRWPAQLSGGMAKRAALARALVNLPRLLLLDEPFGMLDSMTRYRLQNEVAGIRERVAVATVLVTHDVDEAAYLGDRIAVLTTGPCRLRSLVENPLPFPRERTTRAFAEVRSALMEEVLR